MTNETIIKKWRSGLDKFAVAKDYMQEYNREAKKRREPKITKDQALAYVEPIIFDYETKDWKWMNASRKINAIYA